jgi:hypothetical protein
MSNDMTITNGDDFELSDDGNQRLIQGPLIKCVDGRWTIDGKPLDPATRLRGEYPEGRRPNPPHTFPHTLEKETKHV